MISGSNVLIVSVKFFSYERMIMDELVSMGARVDLFDERPSNSFYGKAIIRVKKRLYQRRINQHFTNIVREIKGRKYDYFLLIKGESTPTFFLEFLRKNNPNIKLIYYTYDSFKNNPYGLEIINFFDKKFTFDNNDSKMYNLSFRPLFYASDYSRVNLDRQTSEKLLYDVAFIGTAHSDRYNLSQNVEKWCADNGLRMFNFYYSPSKLLFALKKIADKNFRTFNKKDISFQSLTHAEIGDIYNSSRSILDINHPGQDGLTMRTFETLGAGRKLITTNPNIKSYPFYNKNNICIIDRQNPKLDVEFFETEFEQIEPNISHSMSLNGWVKELFEQDSTIWGSIEHFEKVSG